MKTKNKNKQGISLIVLVITIIVMIILAAAIIISLDNSGIINKANQAVLETDLSQVQHLATLKWSEAYLDKKNTQAELDTYVRTELGKELGDLSKYEITVTERGVDVKAKIIYDNSTPVPEEWKENIVAVVDTVPIPKGFVASQATGESTKAKGLVIYEGEEAVTNSNVDKARITRNQYVWIPVASTDFATKFIRKNFGVAGTLSDTFGSNYWEILLNTSTNMPLAEQNSSYVTNTTGKAGITNTLAEVQAMYESVREYEGFYIARYEVGIDSERTSDNGVLETKLYSMMGKIPYTYIPWTKNNSMNEDTNGAVQAARSMYPVSNTKYGVVSTLTYGVQWDAVLQWWLDTNAVSSLAESTSYGNYSERKISVGDLNEGAQIAVYADYKLGSYVAKDDKSLTYPKESGTTWALSTGALKAANINNVYDMAGNMAEWTMEGFNTDRRTARGGCFTDIGSASNIVGISVAKRFLGAYPQLAVHSRSFRSCLYIKK